MSSLLRTVNQTSCAPSNDSNNNNLLIKRAETLTHIELSSNQKSDNQTVPSNNVAILRKNTLSTLTETSSNKSQLTVHIMNNDSVHRVEHNSDENLQLKTSTPNESNNDNSKIENEQNNLQENSNNNRAIDSTSNKNKKTLSELNSSIPSEIKKYMLNSINKGINEVSIDDVDEEGDKFYDHDDYTIVKDQMSKNIDQVDCIIQKNSNQKNMIKKFTRIENNVYSIVKIVLIFFLIISICIIIELFYCKLVKYNDRAYSCSSQMLNTIRNRLYSIMNTNANQNGDRWVSWSNFNSINYNFDPIFSWFYSKMD